MKRRYTFLLPVLMIGMLAVTSGLAFGKGQPPPGCTLGPPVLTCESSTQSSITLRVCADATTGAPAGVSIHIKKYSDWLIDGWANTGSYTCISLGGNCNGSLWSLGAGLCRSIKINASTVTDEGALTCGVSSDCGLYDLQCDTEYIFRSFAHQDPGPSGCDKSDFSADVRCRTAPCNPTGNCTFTWGYWKTHGPAGCNPPGHDNLWPAGNVAVGALSLSQDDACAILQENPKSCAKGGGPNAGSNAVLILEHQLIAAELNRASGAINCAFANQAITDANALLAGREYTCVGASTTLGQQMLAVKDALSAYNDDQCTCPVLLTKPQSSPQDVTPTKSSTWGRMKTIYR